MDPGAGGALSDLRGAAVLAAGFLGLVGAAEMWRRLARVPPEWSRKLVHVGGGLACLAFPFLIQSPWVVLALALGLFGLFVAGRRLGFLQSLHGVERPTHGTEYYPLAIFLVFLLAGRTPWIYVSAVLVLAVGDALAALIGSRYGSLKYEVECEFKSVEGSAVFLLVAFLAIQLPGILMTDLPRANVVLAALLVATLVTGFEAIALRGADNLFVPLAVCVILPKITEKPLAEIVYQVGSLTVLCVAVAAVARRARPFNTGATLVFLLFAYGAWSLGSEWWAAPILTGFLAYAVTGYLRPRDRRAAPPLVRVRTLFRAVLLPLLLLVTANMWGIGDLLYAPFVGALGAVVAFSLWNRTLLATPLAGWRRRAGAVCGGAAAALLVGLAPALAAGVGWRAVGVLVALVVAAGGVDDAFLEEGGAGDPDRLWGARRMGLTALVAGALLALELAGWLPLWRITGL